MMNPIETITYKGHTIRIYQDADPESPRDWDNLGKMICFHRDYRLGDKHDYNLDRITDEWWEEHPDIEWDSKDIPNRFEIMRWKLEKDGAVILLPLSLYDHSGLRIKIGSFQCLLPQGHAEFDTMTVGFIAAFKDDLLKEYNVTELGPDHIAQATKLLEGEVETYDQFLSGDVYGYTIDEHEDGEKDSCWGCYGEVYCIAEAKGIVDGFPERIRIPKELIDSFKKIAHSPHMSPVLGDELRALIAKFQSEELEDEDS